ncbi:hypothetical protein [Corynebacterium spheniscorum]|uniref:Uncharacterized protein n=1 Tax=Corynebacterium spheniscorum TaxID=185761 RepID=A0A1I2UCZ0_9CORY|nr:hypothetical protein [Corynebacterium spheniscorum]KAA8720372.1 hypothetical protein F4V56_07655 [Corynebacterium spheniscorum]SFG75014.1 hypothetical protein SAMN05660282_01820 [Corynebacterium spheniscorum]
MKKVIATAVAVAAAFAGVLVPTASAAPSSPAAQTMTLESVRLTPQQRESLDKVVAVRDHFYAGENGRLAIDLSDEELKSEYGFTDEELEMLHRDTLGIDIEKTDEEVRAAVQGLKQERVYRNGTAVCFIHDDLVVGVGVALVAAAEAGPAAIAAAISTVSTLIGGPVAGVLGTTLSLAGFTSLAGMGLYITSAVATGRGVEIGVKADYPPVFTTYC